MREETYRYRRDRMGNELVRQNRSFEKGSAPTVVHDEVSVHDRLDRLIGFERGKLAASNGVLSTKIVDRDFAQSWDLDEMGNWRTFRQDADGNGQFETVQKRTFNLDNEIKTIAGWAAPKYDRVGNMIEVPQPADPTKTYKCQYDPWNRLVRVKDGDRLLAEYDYDGLGRRIVKRTYEIDGKTLKEERRFVYSKEGRLLQERTRQRMPSPSWGEFDFLPDKEYVWGERGPNDLVQRAQQIPPSIEPLTVRHFPLTDADFSVTALLKEPDELLNDPAEIVERFVYDPFGNCTVTDATFNVRNQSAFEWNFRHDGAYFDPETGLYFEEGHFYHPLLGLPLQSDLAETDLMGAMGGPAIEIVDEDFLRSLRAAIERARWAQIRDEEAREAGMVGQPGFWEGLIPVWGSGRAAIDDFQHARWGWGTFNLAMAITDVFLVKALIVGAGKLLVKGTAKLFAREAGAITAKEAAGAGFGLGGLYVRPTGPISQALKLKYFAELNSMTFRTKLLVHNLLTLPLLPFGRKWVTRRMILKRLENAVFREGHHGIAPLIYGEFALAEAPLLQAGRRVTETTPLLIGGRVGKAGIRGYINRTFIHHELIHISQMVKNPAIWRGQVARLWHEPIQLLTAHGEFVWPWAAPGAYRYAVVPLHEIYKLKRGIRE